MMVNRYLFKTLIALANLFLGLRNLHDLHYRHFSEVMGYLNVVIGAVGLILWSQAAGNFRFGGWLMMGGCVLLELVTSLIYISVNRYEIDKVRESLKKIKKYMD